MTMLEYFQKTSDVMIACEIISLDQIKDRSYNMDFEEEIDLSDFWDEPIDIDRIKSVDTFGRSRLKNRF